MAEMREKLTKAILENCDGELRVIDVIGLVEAIEELYHPYVFDVDWASIDPDKWGCLLDDEVERWR